MHLLLFIHIDVKKIISGSQEKGKIQAESTV